jgi:hypothetical protein
MRKDATPARELVWTVTWYILEAFHTSAHMASWNQVHKLLTRKEHEDKDKRDQQWVSRYLTLQILQQGKELLISQRESALSALYLINIIVQTGEYALCFAHTCQIDGCLLFPSDFL